jgi:hypothetical protein
MAEDITDFYKTLYNCPLIEAITYWSFTDGGWLNAPAGLMTEDARVKPAYDALYDLIINKWTTPEQYLVTDDNGFVEVTGYKGDYIATYDDGSMNFSII